MHRLGAGWVPLLLENQLTCEKDPVNEWPYNWYRPPYVIVFRNIWRANMDLVKKSPIPLYHQLAELLRDRVASGELPVGSQLPSERELSEKAGISRMTARQAIACLVNDGIVTVKHGLGTFVAKPKLSYDATRLVGFSEEMKRRGIPLVTRVLKKEIVLPPLKIAEQLNLATGDTMVNIVRLRSVGSTPVVLETNHVPTMVCPGLEAVDFEHTSFYSVLRDQYGFRLTFARQSLESVAASKEESQLLSVAPGAPLILTRGVTFIHKDIPVEYFKVLYRGDRFKFELESHRWANPEAGGMENLNLIMKKDPAETE